MEQNKNYKETMKTMAKTSSRLSEAASSLGKSISNLCIDPNLIDNIKPDLGYLLYVAEVLERRVNNMTLQDNDYVEDEEHFSQRLSYEAYLKVKSLSEKVHKLHGLKKDDLD